MAWLRPDAGRAEGNVRTDGGLRITNVQNPDPSPNYLYSYSLPDLKPLGGAELSGKGAGWVTLTPDGKTAYVANPVTNDVSVVDVATMKETTRIEVGYAPKRNVTVALQ